jgi:hypothetical protein
VVSAPDLAESSILTGGKIHRGDLDIPAGDHMIIHL